MHFLSGKTNAPVVMPLPFLKSPVDNTYAAPPNIAPKPARCKYDGMFAPTPKTEGGITVLDATGRIHQVGRLVNP